jgi:hypothetical protein
MLFLSRRLVSILQSEIESLSAALPEIKALGEKLIAISSQQPDYSFVASGKGRTGISGS